MKRHLLTLFVAVTGTSLFAADPIVLKADLTEAPRNLFKSTLTIPAKPGPLTLYYPKWIQAEHQPSGPITDLSGIVMSAGGKRIEWTRDPLDLYAFHMTVPAGAKAVDVSLEYLVPNDKGGFGSGPSTSAKTAIFGWYLVTLYPLEPNQHVRDIPIKASVKLPEGWDAGTALPIESRKPGFIQYKTESLETLIDSPVICGQHFKEYPIGPKNGAAHFLTLAGDSESSIALDQKWIDQAGQLVEETDVLFGARPYRSYRFLTTLSDTIVFNGIEHHESSDNRIPEKALTDDTFRKLMIGGLWSHEFIHSWNGKHRRPVAMCTPDYQQPMKTDMLWVYEGLTNYYGYLLEVRCGFTAAEVLRDRLAFVVENLRNRKGRAWRPLEDTATAAPHLYTAR